VLKQTKIMASIADKIEKAAIELARTRAAFEYAQSYFNSLIAPATKQNFSDSIEKSVTIQKNVTNDSDLTLSEKLLLHMKSKPESAIDYDEIQKVLPGVKMPALRVIIFNLKKNDKIVSAGHGLFKPKMDVI
jgi:hypothetical protein